MWLNYWKKFGDPLNEGQRIPNQHNTRIYKPALRLTVLVAQMTKEFPREKRQPQGSYLKMFLLTK